MGCSGQSASADDNVAIPQTMAKAYNKNWPTITYFELYARGSAIHFQFEHAGQNYNEDLMGMKDWGTRKKDFGGNGLPVVTLPDGMQLAESVPTSIYYGKLFGQYPRDP